MWAEKSADMDRYCKSRGVENWRNSSLCGAYLNALRQACVALQALSRNIWQGFYYRPRRYGLYAATGACSDD
jgi:aminoglycoside phosphotransferase (APT) family kinase protein